ncbi:sulfide/dihydroorotate dehydrogenase-like FAD/NAD-binding protein [Thermococcus thioreducens]|uniref:Ferredoxin-NADP reductase n=1 Tax=Thermococcus thioreducens TaxID=277988 RepID=A0A0Q2S221_9EURY|nr:sulfide/dihydroorotate dehydrogenase-like FAD/NAD-binding protein [Thermococcus thioreducens]ASJ13085.1 ferredoxin-NADP reductase [Thermococcus thioreducens]KQH81595.1 ferredoxin-NADP reductase [Thermococcus thioreducens]SEV81369.1 sulfide dehydrogenase (flavoprotein) subunit SudB [Thermococcus thioreducens]
MYKILEKREIAMRNTWYKVHAPHVARKVQPGQFVIVRAFKNGERIPLTPVMWDREEGWIVLIVFTRGKTTARMAAELREGDGILNIAGPLGNPVEMKKFGKILAIGAYTGIVEVYPIAKAWQELGNDVTTLHVTFEPMVVLKDEMERAVGRHILETVPIDMTKSFPENMKNVTKRLTEKARELLEKEEWDLVFMVGPSGDQRAVFEVVKEFGVPMKADLHPIMVDGTGMCGACRVTVGGEVKFACIDGPEFDAYKVDWDVLISRSGYYTDMEMMAMQEYMKALQGGGQ